jgi:thioredoxin 1
MVTALTAAAQPPLSPTAWRGYDEAADARADIERGRAQAAAGGKRVLIVFGANWCGDCRVLDLTMKQGSSSSSRSMSAASTGIWRSPSATACL